MHWITSDRILHYNESRTAVKIAFRGRGILGHDWIKMSRDQGIEFCGYWKLCVAFHEPAPDRAVVYIIWVRALRAQIANVERILVDS